MVKMVNLPQSTRSETGCSNEENKAIQAYSDPIKIGTADDKEIKKYLSVVFSLVGLATYPDKAAELVLIKFMRSNFAPFSLKEMVLAFELTAAGKLDFEKGKGQHFGQFSPVFFAEVMTAYRVWVTEVRKQYDKPVVEQRKVTITESLWRGKIEEAYESFSEKTNYRLWPVEFYDQLVMDGFIQLRYHEELLTKAREMLCAEANKKMINETDDLKLKKLSDLIVEYRGKYREFEVILLAKQLSVRRLFEYGEAIDTKAIYEYVVG